MIEIKDICQFIGEPWACGEIKQVCTLVTFLENQKLQKYTVEQFLLVNGQEEMIIMKKAIFLGLLAVVLLLAGCGTGENWKVEFTKPLQFIQGKEAPFEIRVTEDKNRLLV